MRAIDFLFVQSTESSRVRTYCVKSVNFAYFEMECGKQNKKPVAVVRPFSINGLVMCSGCERWGNVRGTRGLCHICRFAGQTRRTPQNATGAGPSTRSHGVGWPTPAARRSETPLSDAATTIDARRPAARMRSMEPSTLDAAQPSQHLFDEVFEEGQRWLEETQPIQPPPEMDAEEISSDSDATVSNLDAQHRQSDTTDDDDDERMVPLDTSDEEWFTGTMMRRYL